jgi:hypothetical protein
MAKRMFEDAEMLRGNLEEISGAVDRIAANVEREQARGKRRRRIKIFYVQYPSPPS